METDFEPIEAYTETGQLTSNEVLGIYRTLSVTNNTDYDVFDDLSFVTNCIEELFDSNFKLIESDKLINNSILLNNKFLELVKYCNQKAKFRKVGYIFIGFTDYFNLDYSKTYSQLHEKLQLLIKHSTKCLLGAKTYRKFEVKFASHPEINIPTLFNLAASKSQE